MHTHPQRLATTVFYPLFLASGVTGIRDAASEVPLDTLRLWRQEILAGIRVGPPRQILSGKSLDGPEALCEGAEYHLCIASMADVQRTIDSLKAMGVEMFKMYTLTPEMYFAVAAAVRRTGIPFGGHSTQVGAMETSDSGARIIDHLRLGGQNFRFGPPNPQDLILESCVHKQSASVERCRAVAERLRRNDTWVLSDLIEVQPVFSQVVRQFWATGALPSGNWLRVPDGSISDTIGKPPMIAVPLHSPADRMSIIQRVDLPIVVGTDVMDFLVEGRPPGLGIHQTLAEYVTEGMTPLAALRTATLNPAKLLHATDSLGTVAPGKLADLVLLDADPLADITNTTTIRAVVANGRYFDRAALDKVLADVQAEPR
jgi:hypothetical protein